MERHLSTKEHSVKFTLRRSKIIGGTTLGKKYVRNSTERLKIDNIQEVRYTIILNRFYVIGEIELGDDHHSHLYSREMMEKPQITK